MNERQMEHDLRRHLREQAEAGPELHELRDAIRRRLDGHEFQRRGDDRSSRPRWAVAAAVVGLLGLLGAVLVLSTGGRDASDELIAKPISTLPIEQESLAGALADTSELRVAMSLTIPDSIDREVTEISSSADVLELSLGGPSTANPPRVPVMRIIVPPAESSAESIVADLTSSLTDTRLVEITDDQLGGRPTRVVRMESDLGTTVVGFKLGPGTFVTASGVDRRYEVYVMPTPTGLIVVWIDGARDGFPEIRRDADIILSTLDFQ